MVRHIDWPEDAFAGTPIMKKHDLEMADLLFRPNEKSVQGQRQASLQMAFNSALRMHDRGSVVKLCGFSAAPSQARLLPTWQVLSTVVTETHRKKLIILSAA